MQLGWKLRHSGGDSQQNSERQRVFKVFRLFSPLLVCVFLLAALSAFLLLQGDMNDWVAFMGGEASRGLFAVYCTVGVAGISAVALLKKELRVLDAPSRVFAASFLVTISVGCGVFTYLNFSATQAHYEWMHDGVVYQQMGVSFLQHGEFIVDGNYSRHLGPVYPMYLSLFYAFLPVHLGTQVAVEVIFTLSVVAVFVVTRKLYGVSPALLTTALVATFPSYVFSVSRNYSEPLVLIMYTLTVYFIIESLKPEKADRIILAGLCAGIGFLTKSGIGYFFLITGVAGFLWRFYYMKWQVFKNRNYMVAVAVFLTIVSAWIARNLFLFWDGTFANFFVASQSSDYFYTAMIHSFTKDF
ncbi:MAG: glycosyltransferase family 39 protein, partial [Candidatus Bathyarchaeota archaeon]|nr:glycosyltransferase family 39 protein [Candidatus Bathyarchaeota archaeon]